VLRRGLTFYFLKKLGPDAGRIQGYLGSAQAKPNSILDLAQPMTQGYFGFCRMRSLKIVGSWHAQAPRMRYVCQAPRQAGNPSTTCAQGCAHHWGMTKGPRVHLKQESKSHVGTWGVPSSQAAAQAPYVPTWFFFDSNNSFLKLINDDNNNNNNSNF